jgi:hypothetical protein
MAWESFLSDGLSYKTSLLLHNLSRFNDPPTSVHNPEYVKARSITAHINMGFCIFQNFGVDNLSIHPGDLNN